MSHTTHLLSGSLQIVNRNLDTLCVGVCVEREREREEEKGKKKKKKKKKKRLQDMNYNFYDNENKVLQKLIMYWRLAITSFPVKATRYDC